MRPLHNRGTAPGARARPRQLRAAVEQQRCNTVGNCLSRGSQQRPTAAAAAPQSAAARPRHARAGVLSHSWARQRDRPAEAAMRSYAQLHARVRRPRRARGAARWRSARQRRAGDCRAGAQTHLRQQGLLRAARRLLGAAPTCVRRNGHRTAAPRCGCTGSCREAFQRLCWRLRFPRAPRPPLLLPPSWQRCRRRPTCTSRPPSFLSAPVEQNTRRQPPSLPANDAAGLARGERRPRAQLREANAASPAALRCAARRRYIAGGQPASPRRRQLQRSQQRQTRMQQRTGDALAPRRTLPRCYAATDAAEFRGRGGGSERSSSAALVC